jgi:hypothetical protein
MEIVSNEGKSYSYDATGTVKIISYELK